MKKLIIATAIVCAAVIVQAATAQWKTGGIYAAKDAAGTIGSATGDAKFGATGHKGLFYVFTFATETDYLAAQSLSVSKLYEKYILDSTVVSGAKTANASAYGSTINVDIADGSETITQTYYGMLIAVDKETAASYDTVDAFVKAVYKTASYQDTTGVSFSNAAQDGANWTAYSAVPEPTSGLLLLLGVAGLALRRRRA